MVNTRETVLQLLQNGMSPSEIAQALEISKPAVSKHIKKLVESGLWTRPGVEAAGRQSASSSNRKTNSTRRRSGGAPRGNKNAVGNLGGPGPPRGNKNAVRTGEHEAIWIDQLDDEERELFEAVDTKVLSQLELEIRLTEIRERRMLRRIAELKRYDMTVVEEVEEEIEADDDDEHFGHRRARFGRVTKRKTRGTLGQIQAIEEALTRVQERKAKLIAEKHRVEQGSGPANPDIKAYLEALNSAASEVWAEEPDPDDDDEGEGDDA